MRYTLSYVDGVTFGRRASAPAHFGVGLRDTVCPPSTVFAAYNQYGAANGQPQPPDRTIHVYPFNQQEGGEAVHMRRQLRWLNARMGNRAAATPPGSLRCDASTAAGRGFEFLRRHDLSFSSSARPARSPRHKGRHLGGSVTANTSASETASASVSQGAGSSVRRQVRDDRRWPQPDRDVVCVEARTAPDRWTDVSVMDEGPADRA